MSNSHLLRLPPELHQLILEHLPVPDILQLRLTCTYFYELAPPPSHADLLEVESTEWGRRRDVYTCRYCLRLRPSSRFADRMLRRRRSRGARDGDKRFCIECGLKPRGDDGTARYGPGAQITVQGHFFVFCLVCRQFKRGARDSHGRNTSECASCWGQHGWQWGEGRSGLIEAGDVPH
ncbi:hypothetical protein N7510_001598 [Penicillium lagena]|uniref:uncharacterized protein n=1 Tax=Penicillium lagena TaxID=94218 RepID=UPI0025404DEE|nr:uncharacterized protein N7510_001598 [Penicillium lagena]KAJ5625289.1 hypothetical protein N7510_001598 [Penicillium lagena]